MFEFEFFRSLQSSGIASHRLAISSSSFASELQLFLHVAAVVVVVYKRVYHLLLAAQHIQLLLLLLLCVCVLYLFFKDFVAIKLS